MNKISSSSICIGPLNVYHLYNKCTEVSLLMQKLAPVHLFGISESRLDARITDNLIPLMTTLFCVAIVATLYIQALPCMSTSL